MVKIMYLTSVRKQKTTQLTTMYSKMYKIFKEHKINAVAIKEICFNFIQKKSNVYLLWNETKEIIFSLGFFVV